MNIISVQPITDRPIIDAIAANDFMLIGDASDNNVVKRVLVSSLKSFFTADYASGGQNHAPISANITLQSNKNYLAIAIGLIWLLPVNPSIGDVINLSTGNFSLKVLQNNANHQILNANTLTKLGINNGLILKNNADVAVIFVGNNLWKTVFKTRIINNWIDITTDNIPVIQPYFPTALEAQEYYHIYDLARVNDGNTISSGVMLDNSASSLLAFSLTFTEPIILTGMNYWLGQFNGLVNFPTGFNLYTGSSIDQNNLIQSNTLTNANGYIPVYGVLQAVNTYVIAFSRDGNPVMSVLELQALGSSSISGEVIVI